MERNDNLPAGGRTRRGVLKGAVAGGALFAAQTKRAAAQQTGTMAGRKYRAFLRRAGATASTVEDVTMMPLDPQRVVVRTEASQCCYSIVDQALRTTPYIPAPWHAAPGQAIIFGHGGVGVVEAVGSQVRRVQVGDRVIVANTPYCGLCYNCLRGRADRCQMIPKNGNPQLPIGKLDDGTVVVQWNNEAGFGELMLPYEWYCMPVFTSVSSLELSMLGCVGACGLGTTFGIAPVEPASDVAVLGCGPLGLSAVQGARNQGRIADHRGGTDPRAPRAGAETGRDHSARSQRRGQESCG